MRETKGKAMNESCETATAVTAANESTRRVQTLLCLGRCNPSVPWIDQQIDAYRRLEFRGLGTSTGKRYPLTDERLLHSLRALTHTPHRHIVGSLWTCMVCGTERQSPG